VPAPDLLQRDFTAPRSDLRWVADITEFRCVDGKLYLAGIRDLHDRGLAGWSMGERQTTDLVVAALVMALGRRRPSERLLHHADHGCQHTSVEFANRLADWGITASHGSVGDAYDNAMAEAFFATLECERLDRRSFRSQAEARMAVFHFIEGFYNPTRRHSALGYLSPSEYEARAMAENN